MKSSDPIPVTPRVKWEGQDADIYLGLLIEAATDYAIFAMDTQRRITMWNAGAARIFGFDESEVLGQSADVVFTPEDRRQRAPEAESLMAARDGRAADERWHLRKNGERFFASGVMTALRNASGAHLGFVKIARDLTDRKIAEEQLRASRDDLARRVQERTSELEQANASLRAEVARTTAAEAEKQRLLRRLASAQEIERLRLSREMHDEVGQHIAALMMRLNSLELALTGSPQHVVVIEAQQLAEGIGRELHDLAVQLRPAALDDLGLPGAVSAYVDVWSARSGVPVHTQVVNVDHERLSNEVELALYRVVQEALTNVLKHAGASRVSIVIMRTDGDLALIIEDDGRGFVAEGEPGAGSPGLGLIGMRERVAAIGGSLTIESEPGKGTTVFVRVRSEAR